VLWNAANPAFTPVWRAVDATVRSMGLVLSSQPVREAQDFAAAFAAIVSERREGFLVLVDALVAQYLRQIVEFTVRERLPAVSTSREFAALGGLMSYGANLTATQRKAAGYIDRVLKGENPAKLPFEQPRSWTRFNPPGQRRYPGREVRFVPYWGKHLVPLTREEDTEWPAAACPGKSPISSRFRRASPATPSSNPPCHSPRIGWMTARGSS
jgi:ABC transporter substrate binding protein